MLYTMLPRPLQLRQMPALTEEVKKAQQAFVTIC
jgi:hypothetical protein